MKKIISIILLLMVAVLILKLKSPKQEDYLVKINNYTISLQEFTAEFLASPYARNNTPESKREFLDTLIWRKLILQEAQAKGLDKDKEFLKSIERFWEQSLLKRAMDNKTQEITGSVFIPDSAIEAAYNKLKDEGKADKPYDQMYKQIKWSLTQYEESQAIRSWLRQIRQKARITINPAHIVKKDGHDVPSAQVAENMKDLVASIDVKNAPAAAKK